MENTIEDLQSTEPIECYPIIELKCPKSHDYDNFSKKMMKYNDNLQILLRIIQTKLKENDTNKAIHITLEIKKLYSSAVDNNEKDMVYLYGSVLEDISIMFAKINNGKQLN